MTRDRKTSSPGVRAAGLSPSQLMQPHARVGRTRGQVRAAASAGNGRSAGAHQAQRSPVSGSGLVTSVSPAITPSAKLNPTNQAMVEAAKRMVTYIDHPVKYVEEIILARHPGITVLPHQAEVLDACAEWDRVAMKAANGMGKDTTCAWLTEWFLMTRPHAKVPSTSGVFRQVRSALWAEINRWSTTSLSSPLLDILNTRMSVKGFEAAWFAEGFTADSEQKAEGYHAPHLLYIVTEAKSVAEGIWNAIFKACTGEGNKIMSQSVPGGETGEFFHICAGNRRDWKTFSYPAAAKNPAWTEQSPRSVSKYLTTSPLVSQTSINEKIEKGEDGPLFRAGVLAQFLPQSNEALISLRTVEAAMDLERRVVLMALLQAWPEMERNNVSREIGVDVARFGDDDSVIAERENGYVHPLIVRHGQDTMQLSGLVVSEIRRFKPQAVKVDEIGIGSGVVDSLNEKTREAREKAHTARIERTTKPSPTEEEKANWAAIESDPLALVKIVGVNVGRPAKDKEAYLTLRDELWDMLAQRTADGATSLPDDPDLKAELTAPRYTFDSHGHKRIESKDSIKERGFSSPDRAEAIMLAFTPWKSGLNMFV